MQQQGFCFGFVEFEVASAVQCAIEVFVHIIGPIFLYSRKIYQCAE